MTFSTASLVFALKVSVVSPGFTAPPGSLCSFHNEEPARRCTPPRISVSDATGENGTV